MKFFARPARGTRTEERLRAHYEVERELADRLRNASRAERSQLYGEVYDELFRRVPDHPQLVKRSDLAMQAAEVARQVAGLAPFTSAATRFLEIGAGDCALSLALAPRVRQVWALDVSREIVPGTMLPENFELVLSDGQSVPLPPRSVDLAYSNQLMEHLHPDDAFAQLEAISQVLTPGGRYLCVTPHRFNGPHDISKFFDLTATGFHLHEYTVGELRRLMRSVGFHEVRLVVRLGSRSRVVPTQLATVPEALLAPLPPRVRRGVARSPLRFPLGIKMIATK
ncbi:MAG: class I SAM-dependent methyltransferase [Thermoanaerobaculia bacterium]